MCKIFIYSLILCCPSFFNKDIYAAISTQVACYYQDSDPDLSTNKNHEFIKGGLDFSSNNYYWALDSKKEILKISGEIVDGFFISQSLSYQQVLDACHLAISLGSKYYPTKATYRLYDFKASASALTAWEYPISFESSEEYKSNTINKIVVFGDSLSDQGNLKRYLKVMPYYPYWFGRFSNGPVWNDYFSYTSHIPFLNFSYGGQKTEGTNDVYLNMVPNQILRYLEAYGRANVTGNSKDTILRYLNHYLTSDSYNTKNSALSDAKNTLYILFIGGNDFDEKCSDTDFTKNFFENPDNVAGANYISKHVIANIIEQTQLLIHKGAKNIVIFNLPDLGLIPLVFDMNYHFSQNETENRQVISQKLSNIIKSYNEKLQIEVEKLKNNYAGTELKIDYFDVDHLFKSVLKNKNFSQPEENFDYEFIKKESEIKVSQENNVYNIQERCSTSGYINTFFHEANYTVVDYTRANWCVKSDKETKVSNINNKLNKRPIMWDSVHPSTYLHCFLSNYILTHLNNIGLTSLNTPSISDIKNKCFEFVENNFSDFSQLSLRN